MVNVMHINGLFFNLLSAYCITLFCFYLSFITFLFVILDFYNSFAFISYELMFSKLSASSETAVRTATIASCRSTYRAVATTEGARTVSERSTTVSWIRARSETPGWAGSIATAKAAHHSRTTTETASTVATERTTRSAVV